MIEKIAQRFYKRNPRLASFMIDWGFCIFVQALLLAIWGCMATKISFSQLMIFFIPYVIPTVFLFNLEPALKKLTVTYTSPQNLRKQIQQKLKEDTIEEIETTYCTASTFIQHSNLTYALLCLLIESVIGRILITIIFWGIFELCYFFKTEIEQLKL